ncbi:MAG: hypothetical protein QNK05_24240 [Myxococcota bacterium]|nr:hypothetical protein [Myxococcota bacterium]
MSDPLFFLIVDAVPFDLAHQLWARGQLPGFSEPRPMVAVFPSLTDVAVPALLRGVFPVQPPGYEARYYDPERGEVCGHPGDPEVEEATAPLRARPQGFLGTAAIYLLRSSLSYAQIRWITHRFRVEGGPWLGYLSATDGVAHFDGREALGEALRDVARQVDQARGDYAREHGELPGAVLCSDHGMSFGRLDHLESSLIATLLTRAGFQVGVPGRDGVMLAPCGDVGAGVAHCDPSRSVEVAGAIARAPGVALCFARTPSGCLVFRPRPDGSLETARISWRGDHLRYEPDATAGIPGDPLDHRIVFDGLAARGVLRDGWAPDRELFAASADHALPDAIGRIRSAFVDLVQYPANVLFSMHDAWSTGPALTHYGTSLIGGQVGTHGAITRAASLGFAAASDDRADPWPHRPYLRPTDVFAPFRDRVRAGAEPGA